LWWLVVAVLILVVVALEVSELALSAYLQLIRTRSLSVRVAQLIPTAVILYFLPSHRQVAAAVRLVVRLTAAVLVAAVRTAVALVRLEIRLLLHQVKETMAALVALQAEVEAVVLVQRAVMHLEKQAALAVTVLRQASQAHR
jgi:hypothetical protein